jgi:LuxR family maltose regulon positive regulatory protein
MRNIRKRATPARCNGSRLVTSTFKREAAASNSETRKACEVASKSLNNYKKQVRLKRDPPIRYCMFNAYYTHYMEYSIRCFYSISAVKTARVIRGDFLVKFAKEIEGDTLVAQHLPSSSLLQTKLHIPPIHALCVPRPRLLSRLNNCSLYKLTVISAPAGFGKTTLLSEWACQSSLPIIWLSLNESDNDAAQFWMYMMAGLRRLSDLPGEVEPVLLSPDSQAAALAQITYLISTIPCEFVLILDDFHSIQNVQIHSMLASLLDYLPAHMHICIISRTRPPLPLPRLRAYRQLYELHPVDIAFTLQELETFLTSFSGQAPPPGKALALKTYTDGWIAIVHLIHIWLREQHDGWDALERLPDNHRYILDFLAEEVLQRQPPAIQSFLLQTSILEQFNTELCNAITGRNDAQHIVEHIERAHLFMAPLDEKHHWYKYHPLFRTFLRGRLAQTKPDQVRFLHQRAYTWYEQHNMPDEAIAHALVIKDTEKAINCILQAGEAILMRGAATTLLHWLEALPEERVRLYPQLCLYYAWSLMMTGQFETADSWMENIDSIEKKASAISNPRPSGEAQKNRSPYVQSIIFVLRAHITIFWGEIDNVARLALKAQQNLPEDNLLIQSLNMLNMGVVKWLGKDLIAAKDAFTAAAAGGKRLNNNYIKLATNCGLVLVHMEQGKHRLAFAIAQPACQLISKHPGMLSPFSIYLYTETAYLLYQWNRLDEAAHFAREALAYGEKQNRDVLIYGYTLLSRITQAQGDLDEAWDLIQQAEHLIPLSHRRPWILCRLAQQYVPLALACKKHACAAKWAQIPELDFFEGLAVILPMMVSLSQNNPREALQLAYKDGPEKAQEVLGVVLLCALAYEQLGETSKACAELDTVLQQAEREGHIRLFLDCGPPLVPLLSIQHAKYAELARKAENSATWNKLTAYVSLLLDEFAREIPLPTTAQDKTVGSSPTTLPSTELSQRELDVLLSIVKGLSTQEIAQQMVVAESTIKWHVKNIYSKLHVHNRVQAVIEARKLHLI